MHIDEHIPSDRDCAALVTLLERQGAWLLDAQPRRTLGQRERMQARLDHCAGQVRRELEGALAAAWPAIPFVCMRADTRAAAAIDHSVYWLCDPVDGAVQYLSGLPLWSTTLCLMAHGHPALAVVHEPAAKRSYEARSGGGARCNGVALSASTQEVLGLSIAGTSFPNHPPRPAAEVAGFAARIERVIPHVLAQRWMGPASVALAQVGAGILDAYWELGGTPADWAAGMLVAREAGTLVTAIDGRALGPGCGGILAAGPALHAQWVGLLGEAA